MFAELMPSSYPCSFESMHAMLDSRAFHEFRRAADLVNDLEVMRFSDREAFARRYFSEKCRAHAEQSIGRQSARRPFDLVLGVERLVERDAVAAGTMF